VQGPAFHIQLWAFTQIKKELDNRNMKSKIIGQIHDSMVILVAEDEKDYVDHLVWYFATQKVKEHWPWINVPLMVEHEQSELGGSWAKMEGLGFLKGE
jgi:DNA polymerase I-like protein with 3'-5' exonuclease and polymerase domains